MAIATGNGVGGGNMFQVWVLDGLGGLLGRKLGSSPDCCVLRAEKADARTEARREKSKLKPLRSVFTGIGVVGNC